MDGSEFGYGDDESQHRSLAVAGAMAELVLCP
jgi:hypothetical protein